MASLKHKHIIKNIIYEIACQCASRGLAVSEKLVVFMVKAAVLNPENLVNTYEKLPRKDLQRLVMLCVDRLMDQKSPAMNTIKMQVDFHMNYTPRREFIKKHQKALQANLLSATQEITKNCSNSKADFKDIYHKIIYYVVRHTGFDPTTDPRTMQQETTDVLKSVFPQSKVSAFIFQPEKSVEHQLNEIALIVKGIRHFKKNRKKGRNIPMDLSAVMQEVVPTTCGNLEIELEGTQKLAWQYTALLESQSELLSDCSVHPDLFKQALYNLRQHEIFLKRLQADMLMSKNQVDTLQAKFAETVTTLKSAVRSKTAIETAKVFPHFTALSHLWAELRDEWLVVNMLKNIASDLKLSLRALYQFQKELQLEELLEGVTVQTDQERMAKSAEEQVDPEKMMSCEWLFPGSTDNFDKLRLQYMGMCGYTLIKEDGLLLPGCKRYFLCNPNIGVLKHKENLYCFSSRQAAYAFASNADKYIELVLQRAQKAPELIKLLQLHQFGNMFKLGCKCLLKPIVYNDTCTQTETHPVESKIVKPYEWNEWEARRKAIKLANLCQEVTNSTQTEQSHMRMENSTQIFLPKSAISQTKKDGYSNTPKPQCYLTRLKSKENNMICMASVNLTRDVDD